MRKLLALAVALFAAQCFAAPTITLTRTMFNSAGFAAGTVQVSGLNALNPSYGNPYFVVIYAGGQGTPSAAFQVPIAQTGQGCDTPTHCELLQDGPFPATWVEQATPHSTFAVLYDGNGPSGIPNNCPASCGGWQTAGFILAFSNVITYGVPAPPPITPPAPPPVQPTGSGCSAPSITYGQCLTNNADQWCILAAPRGEVTLNQQSAAGVWGSRVTCSASGITFTNQDNGYVTCWTGSGWRNCP